MKFEELELNELLQKAIQDSGYVEGTPIQNEAIPVGLQGKDITGLAQTGTGKTLAFLIPAINQILNQKPAYPAVLILAPTRELVMQISGEAEKLLKHTDTKVASIIGGTDYKSQELSLSENTGIIVATPGRLIDLVKTRRCNIDNASILIVDEADRMFDMGFYQDLRYIIHRCKDRKQTMLFSATLSFEVMRLSSRFLNEPVNVEIEPEKMITEKIEQKLMHLGEEEKLPYLVNLLVNDTREDQGIVFTNYKFNIPKIVNTLRKYGIAVTGISSQLDQKKRMRLLRDFKAGKYRYMIATDVASRGIDVENIGIVYNYDLPMDMENYVHRIGRTARAGRTGISLSFCSEKDYKDLERIEQYLKQSIPVEKINESYLTLPEGEFEPFQSDDVFVAMPNQPGRKPAKNRPKPAGKQNPKRENRPEKKYPDKKKFAKPRSLNPLEEAEIFLQKADSVLSAEKVPKTRPDSKKQKQPARKKPAKKFNEPVKTYDKSKRNLFDANEHKKPVKKRSFWQKIKTLLGG